MIGLRLWNWLYSIAYPWYECQYCLGQELWQACYCRHYEAVAPCYPAQWYHRRLRAILTGDWDAPLVMLGGIALTALGMTSAIEIAGWWPL